MAIVCQKCGVSGYADLLVYCRRCRKAAEHQYCLEIIPEADEKIEWSCEDCNFITNESKHIVNGQGVEMSNDDLCLSNKENVISNHNIVNDLNISQVSRKSRNSANLHAHAYEIKAWGKTNRRSMKNISNPLNSSLRKRVRSFRSYKLKRRRTKLILSGEDDEIKAWGKTNRRSMKNISNPLNSSLKKRVRSLRSYKLKRRRRKLILSSEDDEMVNIAKESMVGSENDGVKEQGKIHGKSMQHSLTGHVDNLRGEFTTSQSREFSEPNVYKKELPIEDEDSIDYLTLEQRKKLIISIKDDDSTDDLLLEHRKKLMLPIKDDDSIGDLPFETGINILKEMISIHFEMNTQFGGIRELAMVDQKNEENKLEAIPLPENVENRFEPSPLKEVIACFKNIASKDFNEKSVTVVEKRDEEMTSKVKSDDGLIKRSSDLSMSLHGRCKDMLAMPVISWRGWFRVCGRAYGPLIARLSPKAGEKAWKATESLPQVIQLTMVSRSHAWPRSFEVSPPTDDNIALAFFPPDSRVEKMVDQLVQEVIRCDLMLKVALDEAELLIFPSNMLPENYNRYQDKYYFWGVFRRKDSDKNTADIRMPEAIENNSTKQAVHNSPAESGKAQMKRYMEMSLEGDGPQEILCPLKDEEMCNDLGPDEEFNGCLELFPTHVENIALRLNSGDGEKGVDLELGLNLPSRQ